MTQTLVASLPRRAGAGLSLAAVLVAVASVGILTGPHAIAVLAGPAFLLGAVAIALRLLTRQRWEAYLAFAVSMWLITPEIRRIVDYGSGFHALSPVLLTGPIVGLVALPWVYRHRQQAFRDVVLLFATAIAVFGYGFLIGCLRTGPTAAASAAVNLFGPLALGLFVLAAPIEPQALRATLVQIAVVGAAVLGVYGIIQFLVLPAWDLRWIQESGITTLGQPIPLHVRVFGPLNTAGPYGETLAVLCLLALHHRRTRDWWQFAVIAIGVVGVGLSLVRAAWILLALSVVLLLIARRLPVRLVIGGGVALAVTLLILGTAVRTQIADRLSTTAAAGSQDTSFNARVAFQAQIAPQALADVSGQGLGSTGGAARLAPPGTETVVQSFDSGVFENIFTLGSVPGLALLLVTGWCISRVWRRARYQPAAFAFIAAPAVGLALNLIFTNTFSGVYGAMLWVLLGVAGRPDPGVESEPA